MSEMSDALERQMLAQMDAAIDNAIPRAGVMALSGLGIESRLDAPFGAIEDRLTAPFGGLGNLGAIAMTKFTNVLKGIMGAKRSKAKAMAPKVAAASKQAMAKAVDAKRAADGATNVVQKQRLLTIAKTQLQTADVLKAQTAKLAQESVAPTVTRAEAKAAMVPVIKEVAQKAAQAGKNVIAQAAKPGGWWSVMKAVLIGIGPIRSTAPVGVPEEMPYTGGKGADMMLPGESFSAWAKRLGPMPGTQPSSMMAAMPSAAKPTTGYLTMGDLGAATQEMEVADIEGEDCWDIEVASEDLFGY